jgi:hypothetical protein
LVLTSFKTFKDPKSTIAIDFGGAFYYDYAHNDYISNSHNDYSQAQEVNHGPSQ